MKSAVRWFGKFLWLKKKGGGEIATDQQLNIDLKVREK